MTLRISLLALALPACGSPPTETGDTGGPCDPVTGEPAAVELSHYGTFAEPFDVVYCGIPPQGGAPYAPFGVRARGVVPGEGDAFTVTMRATDRATDEEIGVGDFVQAFLCSNVGDNDGWWVASEFHMRFYDHTLDDLHGRDVRIDVSLSGATSAGTSVDAVLDCVAGD